MKKILKKTWEAIKETTTSFSGCIILLFSFLLLSGVAEFSLGYIINNAWLINIGWAMFAFYWLPMPLMPMIPITIIITVVINKIVLKIRIKKRVA